MTARFDIDGTIDMIAAVLDSVPKLDGAACDGQHELFDGGRPGEHPDDVAYRHAVAATICRNRCPALPDCARWLDRLAPRRRPAGVVAGTIPDPARTAGRPKTNTSKENR
ncbi:hypothetical protein ACXYTP_17750 [Tsukamurella ocularis]